MLAMAGEVVEIASSDDEFKEERRPIGWNYQGITKNNKAESKMGDHIPKTHRKSEEDIVIVELTPEKIDNPTPDFISAVKVNFDDKGIEKDSYNSNPRSLFKHGESHHGPQPKIKSKPMIISSTRMEIKSLVRNKTQASISDFFQANAPDLKRKQPDIEYPSNKIPHKRVKFSSCLPKSKNELQPDKEKIDDIHNQKIDTEKNDNGTNFERKGIRETDLPLVQSNRGDVQEIVDQDTNSENSKGILKKFILYWNEIKAGNDKNDKKIEDKIWKYYYLAHSSYTHSKKFTSNVELAINRMTIDNVYVLIKDLLDSLKSYKDVPYKEDDWYTGEEAMSKFKADTEADTSNCEPSEPLTEEEKKREKKLQKIEKMMKKISEKIKDLDEAEVDLNDDDNSAYLVQERLKAQFMKLDDYYCKLAHCSRTTGRPVEKKFKYDGSRYPEINLRITAWISKHREFPDYQDVLNLVKKVTNDSLLPLRPETVRVQAQEIFRDVGRMLKERRESDDLFSIYSYAAADAVDPANIDKELAERLDNNAQLAQEKLTRVFQEFVDKEAEQREMNDKKIATGEDLKNKTSTDDETEKDSKESDETTKDSDDTNTHDSDDTAGDNDDLPKDSNEDSNDYLDDGEDCNVNPKMKYKKNVCDDKDIKGKLNERHCLSPIQQEEIVFDAGEMKPVYAGENDEFNRSYSYEEPGEKAVSEEETRKKYDCEFEETKEWQEISESATLPDIAGEGGVTLDKDEDTNMSTPSIDNIEEPPIEERPEEFMAEPTELKHNQVEEDMALTKGQPSTKGVNNLSKIITAPKCAEEGICATVTHFKAVSPKVTTSTALIRNISVSEFVAASPAACRLYDNGRISEQSEVEDETNVNKENRTPDKISSKSFKETSSNTKETSSNTKEKSSNIRYEMSIGSVSSEGKTDGERIGCDRLLLSPKKAELSSSVKVVNSVARHDKALILPIKVPSEMKGENNNVLLSPDARRKDEDAVILDTPQKDVCLSSSSPKKCEPQKTESVHTSHNKLKSVESIPDKDSRLTKQSLVRPTPVMSTYISTYNDGEEDFLSDPDDDIQCISNTSSCHSSRPTTTTSLVRLRPSSNDGLATCLITAGTSLSLCSDAAVATSDSDTGGSHVEEGDEAMEVETWQEVEERNVMQDDGSSEEDVLLADFEYPPVDRVTPLPKVRGTASPAASYTHFRAAPAPVRVQKRVERRRGVRDVEGRGSMRWHPPNLPQRKPYRTHHFSQNNFSDSNCSRDMGGSESPELVELE